MKALIMCVGTRDPHAEKGTEGPILSFFDYIHRMDVYKDYKPDKVYLLSTAKKAGSTSNTQERGEETKKLLEERYKLEVYPRLIDVPDPTDYSKLLPEMKNIVSRIMEELKGLEVKYLINVSPGLPQMQAVWFALENAGVIRADFLQVKSPSEEHDELKRVRKIEIFPLFEDNLIKIGLNFLKNYSFNAAADSFYALRDNSNDYERSEAAELIGNLSLIYAKWDKFDYKDAYDNYNKVNKRSNNLLKKKDKFSVIKESIDYQCTVLNELKENQFRECLIDLYHNAVRRHELGQNMDCILRAYLVYERILIRTAMDLLNKETGFSPDPNKFNEEFKEELKKNERLQNFRLKCFGNGVPYFIEREDAINIIRKFDYEPEYEKWAEFLRKTRNRSVHQMKSIDDNSAKACLDIALKILIFYFKSIRGVEGQIEDFPFSRKNLNDICKEFELII